MLKHVFVFIMVFNVPILLLAQNPYHDAIYFKRNADPDTLTTGKIQINYLRNSQDSVVSILTTYIIKADREIILIKVKEWKELEAKLKDESDDNAKKAINSKITAKKDSISLVLSNAFEDNPFIALPESLSEKDVAAGIKSLTSGIPAISSLNVTNIADGLAKFLVERTKQELSIAFFQKFYKTLDERPELNILFPATYKTLKVIGDEIYMFSGYIEMLRQAFQKDLATLLPNVKNLIDDTSMDPVFAAIPQLRTILSDGLYLAVQLQEGKHIGDALNSYADTKIDSAKLVSANKDIYASIVLLNIFSQSLRMKEGSDQYWITSKQLKALGDEKTLKIYLGLIYQQIYLFEQENSKLILNDKFVLERLKKGAKNFNKLKDSTLLILRPIVEKGSIIDEKFTQIKKLQEQPDAEPGYNEYYQLLDASLNFVEVINTTYTSFSGKPISSYFDKYITSARSFGNIYVNVNEKQYVSAVAELAFLYQEMIVSRYTHREKFFDELLEIVKDTKEVEAMLKEIESLEIKYRPYFKKEEGVYDNIKNLESSNAIKTEIKAKQKSILAGEADLLEMQEKIVANLLKYGNFAALVAKAENSDQVQQAIESVALPAGSASIKKHSKFNLALNAYTGLFYGNEFITDYKQGWSNIYGVSAPIGVAASFPLKIPWTDKKFPLISSFSLYGSLIDIGTLVSYRFKDDETESLPEVSFQNIFAPGVYGILGFTNVPISLGYGWQQGPQLREVNIQDPITGEFTNDTANGYRWSIFIAVDIPLINFYTKSK